jgi:hypothetical protein
LEEARSRNSAGGCVALLNNERLFPAAATRFRSVPYQGCVPSLEGWKSCGTYYPLCFLLSSEQPRSRQPDSYVSKEKDMEMSNSSGKRYNLLRNLLSMLRLNVRNAGLFALLSKSTCNLERTDPSCFYYLVVQEIYSPVSMLLRFLVAVIACQRKQKQENASHMTKTPFRPLLQQGKTA